MRVTGVNKRAFKRALVALTGCKLQHDGWPCGTCFPALTDHPDLAWKAVLAYRGDYDTHRVEGGYRFSIGLKPEKNAHGYFDHIYRVFPEADLQRAIREVWAILEESK